MDVREIRTVAVVGAGLMGHGIAQEFALDGYPVGLHAPTDDRLREAALRIRANLEILAVPDRKPPADVMARIRMSADLAPVVSEVDLVYRVRH